MFVFQLNCVDDDQYLLDNQLYSLDYRPIDGDVTLPQNSFRTQDFVPHGKKYFRLSLKLLQDSEKLMQILCIIVTLHSFNKDKYE